MGIDLLYAGDNDRLFVVDNRGVLLPGFRSKMNRVDELESLDPSSQSSDVGGVMVLHEKGLGHHEEVMAFS